MSSNPLTAVGNYISGTAISVVSSGLHVAANGAEKVNHAIFPAPKYLSVENEIDGVYHSSVARLLENIRAQLKRGVPFTLTLTHVASIVDVLVTANIEGGMDDRLYLLETVLVFLSRFPPDTVTARTLNSKVIALLWLDLAHPPASLVGSEYQFRKYDGSGTSIWKPEIGKAGSAYARSVQGQHPLPLNQLPSSELLFDTLLKRDEPVDHPAGLSSCFFAFANLVIHSLFSTNLTNTGEPINKVSSYLDLSPIYGSSEEENKGCRTFDGTGSIFPDTFVDPRLLRMPPSTPAVLVCFARNHNYIVKKLLQINERGTWSNPPPTDDKKKKEQDEELFQTARLINCGWFMSTILGDYLAAILGLVREGNSWSLDPLAEFRDSTHAVVERGTGNVVSIEFLALYHFHSAIATSDEKWAEGIFKRLFPGKTWDDITVEDYEAMSKAGEKRMSESPTPPKEWTFGELTRGKDGSFPDAGLAKIIQDATANPASAFKARGTPHVMRIIEIVAIEQNRKWGTCSLNEFRKFLGLRPYKTFEEWNPAKEIADAAQRLYQHPDNIELYVGLQAEQSKKPIPGAGLCPGFTMSRAILADAVALVRGDRFLTNDFTSYNLTCWGFEDCARDPNNSSNGGMLGKLLTRVLPDHFPVDSSYTNFPFMVPSSIEKYLSVGGTAKNYTYDRPLPIGPVTPVTKYDAVIDGLTGAAYASNVPTNTRVALPGPGYFATYNDIGANANDRKLIADAFAPASALAKQVDYLEKITKTLIHERSYTLVGARKRSINVVRDVLNLVPVYFVSSFILGLPLKTAEHPHGTFLDQELYLELKEIYNYILTEDDPSTKIAKGKSVKEYCANLKRVVEAHLIGARTGSLPVINLVETVYRWIVEHPRVTHEWLSRLLVHGRGKTQSELANDAVALAVVASVEFSQALTHVVDTFLGPGPAPEKVLYDDSAPGPSKNGSASPDTVWTPNLGEKATPTDAKKSSTPAEKVAPADAKSYAKSKPSLLSTISSLVAGNTDPKNVEQLKQHITEALRTRPVVPGVYRTLKSDVKPKADGTAGHAKGDRVFLSFTAAGTDPSVWGKGAKAADPLAQPLFAGALVKLLGPDWLLSAIVPVITTIFRLEGIARAPGNSGLLVSFVDEIEGTKAQMYLDSNQQPTPWSSDLTICYTE